jgi:hypothetical protein
MADKNFPFIVLSGPKVDAASRRIIRKQAMKDVGEARKKRGYGRVNMRQMPVFEDTTIPIRNNVGSDSSDTDWILPDLSHTDASDSSGESEPIEFDEEVMQDRALVRKALPVSHLHRDGFPGLAAINLFTQYETARAKFMLDLPDLSILTNFNVGKSTISILSADPTRLATLLGHPQW